MAGNSAASNLEGFVYIAMHASYDAALTFVGQNVGAKKYDNIKKVTRLSVLCATVIGLGMALIFLLLKTPLVGLYVNNNEAVASVAYRRMFMYLPFYFMCGVMETLGGVIRGMGKSITTMVNSLFGACVVRIVWIHTVFRIFPTIECVYISYPVSWGIVIALNLVFTVIYYKRLVKTQSLNTVK